MADELDLANDYLQVSDYGPGVTQSRKVLAAAVSSGLAIAPGWVPCWSENVWPHTLSDGVKLTGTWRQSLVTPFAVSDLRFVFVGQYNDDSSVGNSYTLKVAVELAGLGNTLPVTFQGRRTVTVDSGAVVVSDPIAVDLAPGTQYFVRSYTVCTGSNKIPLGHAGDAANDYTNWAVAGSDVCDNTGTAGLSSTNAFMFGPFQVLTKPATVKPIIAFVGDSILRGAYDTPEQTKGFTARICDANGWSNIRLARAGETAQQFAQIGYRMFRSTYTTGATHAFIQYGINDFVASRSAAQVQADVTTIAAALRSRGVSKVYLMTVTPKSTSSDSWATTANQTKFAQDAARVTYNTWVRTSPTGFDGYVELADLVESSRNSGIWKAGYTDDGLHPNATGHPYIATNMVMPAISL